MFCEAVGKECGYLEQIERLRQDTLLEKASAQTQAAVREVEAIEKLTLEFTDVKLQCTPEFCVALGQTVRNALVTTALEVKKDNDGR